MAEESEPPVEGEDAPVRTAILHGKRDIRIEDRPPPVVRCQASSALRSAAGAPLSSRGQLRYARTETAGSCATHARRAQHRAAPCSSSSARSALCCSPLIPRRWPAQLKPTDLIIVPEAVGICGSDFSYYCKCQIGGMDITFPDVHDTRFGGILGHECAGTVLKVGSAVADKFAVGDRVAIEPGTPCGCCARCREGRYNLCPDMRFLGSFMSNYPGALRTKMPHPSEMCYKIPDHISFEEAAMLEPMAVGTQAVRRGRISMGDKVLIAGAGPVGFLTMLIAKAAGATQIGMTDINENRLQFAKDYGEGNQCETYDVTKEGVVDGMPDDFDVAIDCTGVVSSSETCIQKLRKGGMMVLVGMGSQKLDVQPILTKELDMVGVFRYCSKCSRSLSLRLLFRSHRSVAQTPILPA